jgi:AcrR family transcriptional regulator
MEPSPRTSSRALATRKKILAAAELAFLERGFTRTSLAEVAAAAGVSTASVFRHFPTKDDLFVGVVQAILAEAHLPDPAQVGLEPWAQAYAALLTRPEIIAVLRLLIAEAVAHASLVQAFYAEMKGPLFAPLVRHLAASGVDHPPLAARQLAGLIEGHVLLRGLLEPSDPPDPAHLADVVSEALATWRSRFQAPLGVPGRRL